MNHAISATDRLSPEQMAEILMLPSWGKWARPRYNAELGAKPPGWVREIPSGWREEKPVYFVPIEDEYAERLDAAICEFLSESQRDVLREIYVYEYPFKVIVRRLKRSLHNIRQDRDTGVGMLYGAFRFSAKNA